MRKRYLLLLIPMVVALFEFGPRIMMSQDSRITAFRTLRRWCGSIWPSAIDSGLAARDRVSLLLWPALMPRTPVWQQVNPHIKMWLDPEDLISRMILVDGVWEPRSVEMLAAHLPAGATFVDVGAHIGYYSLEAASKVGNTGHVIAVEPNPDTLRVLRMNLEANHAAIVTVAPVACSDAESTLDLYEAAEANTGESSLSKSNASQAGSIAHTYKVRARPLDDIVRESGVTRVDAIKIDVEGAEYLVLKGAEATLDRFHPVLVIEIVDQQLRSMGASAGQVRAFLTAHGYREGRHSMLNVEFLYGAAQAN